MLRAMSLPMNNTNKTVDLLALYAEVTAEREEAERIESERACDEIVDARKAEIRAHRAMVRAANKRGLY
jgi:hypothetical protein